MDMLIIDWTDDAIGPISTGMTYVVLGVSGNTGSVVAQALLDQKRPVRVVVRDAKKGEPWKQKGAEVAVADVEDQAALTRAFAGATGVYALIPPNMQSEDFIARGKRIADGVTAAAKATNVPHLVFLSSIGAQFDSGHGPIRTVHYFEKKLREAGVVSTFVRASYFMENNLNALAVIKSQGILPVFADPTYSLPMIASRDIGLVAAKALLEGAKETTVIELSGPREYTVNEVAEALSRALGKAVKTVVAPLEQLVPALKQMGATESTARLYEEMYRGMGAGKLSWEGGTARAVRGTIDIDTFIAAALSRAS